MLRTYFPCLGLALGTAGTALALLQPAGWSAALFDSRPLDQTRFAVLGQPVGRSDWKLLVLEQIKAAPRCWEPRDDGLIDPALNRFDFSGICSRYLDSNGYSLRIGDQDLASRYRLRLEQSGNTLQLLAMSPDQASELLVGQGRVNQRDRDGFVLINLQPNWQLERRSYGQQTLSHVYFANRTPLQQLLSEASGAKGSANSKPLRSSLSRSTALPPLRPLPQSEGPIALQVVPFSP